MSFVARSLSISTKLMLAFHRVDLHFNKQNEVGSIDRDVDAVAIAAKWAFLGMRSDAGQIGTVQGPGWDLFGRR